MNTSVIQIRQSYSQGISVPFTAGNVNYEPNRFHIIKWNWAERKFFANDKFIQALRQLWEHTIQFGREYEEMSGSQSVSQEICLCWVDYIFWAIQGFQKKCIFFFVEKMRKNIKKSRKFKKSKNNLTENKKTRNTLRTKIEWKLKYPI